MGRRSKVESHPDREEIDRLLIEARMSQREIGDRFNLSREAIRWHYNTRIKPILEEMKPRLKAKAEESAMGTLEVLNQIIAQLDDEALTSHITINHILRALELRAKILGEELAPPRIEVVWGKGRKKRAKEKDSELESDETDETIEARIEA